MPHSSQKNHRKRGRFQQFGDLVRRRRESLGLSQEAVAEQVGIARAHLSRIEHGDYQPSPIALAKMAMLLEISIEDAYALTGYMPSSELPGLKAYLKAKHGDWPENVIDKIDSYCDFLKSKHGLSD